MLTAPNSGLPAPFLPIAAQAPPLPLPAGALAPATWLRTPTGTAAQRPHPRTSAGTHIMAPEAPSGRQG